MNLLSTLKVAVVPSGPTARTVKAGAFRGIRMQLDLGWQTQLFCGFFEREIQGWLKTFSSGVGTAVDIGANQGEYTLYFLHKTDAKRVFVFEPDKAAWRGFHSNLILNGLDGDPRLTLSDKFVGACDTDTTCSLDSSLRVSDEPYLIKLDVDGGEVDVLQGAPRILATCRSRWIIETHSRSLEEECVNILRNAGFWTHVVVNAWWRKIVPEQRPLEHNRWLIATNEGDFYRRAANPA